VSEDSALPKKTVTYFSWYIKLAIESTFSAQELDDVKASIRERLLAENPNPAGLNLGVQMHLDQEFADRAGVPRYEEWRKQQT
jgi:hypothetical protein